MAESPLLTPSSDKETLENNIDSQCDSPAATKVTGSNTSSETASIADEQDDAALVTSLARQLEFYFSPQNLPRDTYLQTLQGLNDGYVPVTILANFAKVQALCGGNVDARLEAVTKAANSSSVLEVVSISTTTNKKVTEDDEESKTILAVGPCVESASTVVTTTTEETTTEGAPKSPVQNTIILRDVPAEVTEDDVRGLFEALDTSVPLRTVHLDVANCWFVTLDSCERDEIMNVMLELRSKQLKGEPVKARLKAVTPAPPPTSYSPAPMYDSSSPPRKQKKKQQQQQQKQGKSSRTRRKANKPSPPSPKKVVAPPPLLEEESHFPSLVDSPVVDNMDKVADPPKKTDGASTATTSTTSSLVTPPVPPTGYAAALLKQPSPTGPTPTPKTVTANGNTKKKSENEEEKSAPKSPEPMKEMKAVPMAWGSGRSFADVVKKEEASSSS